MLAAQLRRLQRVSFLAIMPVVLLFSAFAMPQSRYSTNESFKPVQMVAVVRDYTASSHCTMSFSSRQTIACPTGTILQRIAIPLTEAQARHEQYVVLPPRNSSPQVIQSIEMQLRKLADSAKKKYHHTISQSIRPLIACGTTTQTGKIIWSAPGTTFESDVAYYREPNPNCNYIQIDWSAIEAVQIGAFYYWDHDQYADWSYNKGCQQIGNNPIGGTVGYPWLQVGFTYETWVSNGSNCTWWDTDYWPDLGPLY